MNTETHISFSVLRQQIVLHKSGQRLLPDYIPPEGHPGQGGADADTELKGFHRDFDRVMEAVLTKYAQGGARQEIGRTLTQIAAVQPPNSCGPYLRATMLELREVIAPDYLPTLARQRLATPTFEQTMAALTSGRPVDGAETAIADLNAGLRQRPEARPDVPARLHQLADDYASSGDEYMAETATILAARARDFLAEKREQQLDTAVTALRQQEAMHDFSHTIDYSPTAPEPRQPTENCAAKQSYLRPRR